MLKFILRRLLQLVPVLLILSVLVFSLVHLVPGDPVDVLMGEGHTDPVVEAVLRAKYGLDQPIVVQYFTWLGNILTGDFGSSLYTKEPILDMIADRFPATLLLAFASAIVAIVISIPAGIVAALYRGSLLDFGAMGIALFGISVPNFWFGILLILFFSQMLGLLPSMGYVPFFEDPWTATKHLIMPALTLGTAMAANLTRLVRAEMIEQMSQEYVRTARAKGAPERIVIGLHVLKNAMIPTVTIIGLQFGGLLEGAVLTETIFAWPGIGKLAVTAVYERDYALIQGVVLFAALVYVAVSLLVDISYRFLDPRVKLN
ncbi:Glutathione transport system permease protein GsiC [Thalassovita gelatinovora]|uniref:Glutathione transport system permease protein GsiC n=1 Tax=Thalassovita gelatinovora TaxID=53501 RepID=A0A0P1FLI8_THAGE|nr:nickel ABC transporter permease [Thalassovita gelatinovora]QIZ82313.1 ABC transporter permease [Thalassovita gelatinovora]CUH68360.1 Glutathione transport system permease protein GsiC [Thalassovita gelatinovora]SER19347.1 peptide/nickel transport system permease protein [Thalassovita gelatinovora]